MSETPKSSPWKGFAPFSNHALEAETERFVALEKEMAAAWEEECAKYEQTMTAVVNGESMQVPRRNYINKDARVEDPTLFPYHSSCYALLDAYDNLYHSPNEQPVSKDAVPAQCFPPPPAYIEHRRADDELSSFLPCSIRAIAASIFQLAQVEGLFEPHANILDVMHDLYGKGVEHDVTMEQGRCSLDEMFRSVEWRLPSCFKSSPLQTGPVPFPPREQAATLLLKLLKHATSEIQRDHVLAQAVLCRLCVEGHLEDVSVFSQVMTLLASEHITCENPCDEPEDHVCADWCKLCQHWIFLFGYHTSVLTVEHGLAIAGFVRHLFSREFGHLMMRNNNNDQSSIGEKMKKQLKRNLILRREDYADDRENINDGNNSAVAVPEEMILYVLNGLRRRAQLERERINAFLREEEGSTTIPNDQTIEFSLQAYYVCLSTLISISEAAVTMLPPIDRFRSLTSDMVTTLMLCLIPKSTEHVTPIESYIGALDDDLDGIATPFRFAEKVQKAATLRAQRSFPSREASSSRANLLNQCRQILYGQPPDEIRVVVRQLFVRDMVDMQDAWLGFGDFLVWCRYDVNPLDPALFCHEFNYRIDDDDESDDDSEEEDQEDYQWDVDEHGTTLTASEMRDRFDFTLLALQCAWHEPWTAESHPTFQPGFRTAVFEVALCLHHTGMPREIHGHIVQYLARDWWPDTRASCWNYDCMLAELRKQEECRDAGEEYVPPAVTFCVCGVAAYCSRTCRENDWKSGGHKRMCGKPPYCRPTVKEYRFCEVIRQKVLGVSDESDAMALEQNQSELVMDELVVEDEDEGDDGSWESVDSDEEMEAPSGETRTTTSLITEFFKAHYKDR